MPEKPFLSKTAAADTADIKAIYATRVAFQKPGKYAVLAGRKGGRRPSGSCDPGDRAGEQRDPNVGQRPPAISTDTIRSPRRSGKIDTRVPQDDMHKVDFKDVIGKRPVVLLFATPQLCQSRVCGPVTDLELQLEHKYGDHASFIHEEVYARNDADKGLRPQLLAFHLRTEPCLFTFDRHGRVAARLEDAFGVNAFTAAVEAALR